MDNFKKILVDIQDLIKSSNGNLINYGKSNFIFKKRYDVSLDEINDFEKKNIKSNSLKYIENFF